jgi:beta-glucosidase
MATLYHWDLPQALQDEGGWAARDTVDRFVDYAAVVTDRLGDLLPTITTFNEPEVVAFRGHATGRHAPGHQGLAHRGAGLAPLAPRARPRGPAIRSLAPAATAGGCGLQPDDRLPGDRLRRRPGSRRTDGRVREPMVARPAPAGAYPGRPDRGVRTVDRPARLHPGRRPRRDPRAVDYVGVNYYTCARVRSDPPAEFLGIERVLPHASR